MNPSDPRDPITHDVELASADWRASPHNGCRRGEMPFFTQITPVIAVPGGRILFVVFQAQVVRVLIASPADVTEERDRIEDVIHRWNADHAEASSTVLLPVRWEAQATAESGDRPQAVINRQLVDASDVIIGVFWTRLGTPTGAAESGTAEEIQRSIEVGKAVGLFFSNRPVVPNNLDSAQLDALASFRQRQRESGLVQSFDTLATLERQASSMLVSRHT